jgi:pimeloyl-ACP methyl ester carboxylesterase
LLIHGSGGRAEIWSPVMDIFREIDPLAIEMPGHGESPLPFLRSLEDHVLLVEDIRSVLGVDQCIVVGHSLGGAVALQYARDFPSRCGAIVAVSSGPDFIVDLTRVAKLETEWEASIEHFARGQVSPNANSDMLDRARQLIRTRRPATLAHDLRVCTMFSAHNWLGRLQVPTLVVCAYEDSLTPFEGSRSLASRIPGAALSVISPGGHSLMLEHPIRFARAIDAFVEHLRVGEP